MDVVGESEIDPAPTASAAPDEGTLKKLHQIAMKRWKRADEWERMDRELCVEDLRFAAGGEGQWPRGMAAQRQAQDRPMITINRLAASIKQVVNDARQNKPGIRVIPGGTDDPQHEKVALKKAEIYEGLIRQIEQCSRAQQVYLPAYELVVRGGFRGSWRVTTRYVDDESFDQEIYLEPITSPFSVYRDPDSKELDHADDKWAFVCEDMTKAAFRERFPDQPADSWEMGSEYASYTGWVTLEKVRVAEYWYIDESETKAVTLLDNGETVPGDVPGHVYDDLHPQYPGYIATRVRTRRIPVRKVMRLLMSGSRVLEGPDEFPSKYIPIVSVEGPRQWDGEKMLHSSLIRDAKGPQVLYNVSQTNIAERIGLAPKQPFIATPVQVAGFEAQWDNANKTTQSTLLYNPDPMAPGAPQRQMPAPISQAEIALSQQSIDDIKATMGIFDRSLGASSQETSGRAILAVQAQGNNATYDFPDALATAIGYCGRVIVDMIPRVMNSRRVVRATNEDGSTISHVINDPQDDATDLTVGRYDVVVTTGPSFASRRMESATRITELAQAVPQIGLVGADILVRNQDFPGADELADRLKKTLPPGLAAPEDGDAGDAQTMAQAGPIAMPQPDAPQQGAQAQPQEQGAPDAVPGAPDPSLLIEMRKVKADVEYKEAQTERLKLETQQIAMEMQQAMSDPTDVQQMVSAELERTKQEIYSVVQQALVHMREDDADHEQPLIDLSERLAETLQSVVVAARDKPKRMAIHAPSGAVYEVEMSGGDAEIESNPGGPADLREDASEGEQDDMA